MTSVKIVHDRNRNWLIVTSPYHPDLPSAAHNLDGSFQGKDGQLSVWTFDPRNEERVRELYRKIYGTDGTAGETVTVRLNLDLLVGRKRLSELFFAGRKVAWRRSRDEDVRLGDSVILIEGGFPGSGGSVRYPDLDADLDAVLEVRDVPAGHSDLDREGVTVLDTAIDRDALAAERTTLLARVAEIDTLLTAQP